MRRLFLSMGAVTTLFAAFHFLTSGSCGAEKDKPAASEGKTLDQQLAVYQKLASVFEAIEPTNVKGKRWVVVDTGATGPMHRLSGDSAPAPFFAPRESSQPSSYPSTARGVASGESGRPSPAVHSADPIETVEGWLLAEQGDAILVLDGSGTSQRLRKPRTGEQRPALTNGRRTPEEGSASGKSFIAWQIRPGNFVARCQQLKKGLEERAMLCTGQNGQWESSVIGGSRYAHWAAQVGEKRLALDLYTLVDREPKTDGEIVNAWNRNIIPWWLLLPHGVSGAIKGQGGLDQHGRHQKSSPALRQGRHVRPRRNHGRGPDPRGASDNQGCPFARYRHLVLRPRVLLRLLRHRALRRSELQVCGALVVRPPPASQKETGWMKYAILFLILARVQVNPDPPSAAA